MHESNDVPSRQCVCCKESFPLTAEYFHRSKDGIGGFVSHCKPCNLTRYKSYRREHRDRYALSQEPPPAIKCCSACGQQKPATADYFGVDKYQKGGLRSQCKECVNRQQREKYPDRLPQRKAFKEKNREKIAADNKRYREENAERYRKSHRDSYKRLSEAGKLDRKQRSEWTRAWRNRNQDHLRRYYESKRGSMYIQYQKRQARKAALPDNFTPQDWQFALDYFGGCCAACGRPPGLFHTLAMDHFVPLSSPDCTGTVPANIIPLCHGMDGCNNKKHNFAAEKWLVDTFGKKQGKAILAKIQEFFSKVRQI